MDTLFVALGVLVFVLLVLLIWFVPHLMQQQTRRVAKETSQLREMLLDLLNEQEAVTLRQTQLGGSLTGLRDHLEILAKEGFPVAANGQIAVDLQQVEARIGEMQGHLHAWVAQRERNDSRQNAQDNESWAYVLSLLAAIQARIGDISQERAAAHITTQASAMLQELEQEMHNLHAISEDIERLQWRLRRSIHEREGSVSTLRTHVNGA